MEDQIYCRNANCKSSNVLIEWREDRQTYLIRCNDCKKTTWQPLPESKNRPASHTKLVKKKGIEYCQLCFRDRSEIPPPGTLEGHHIIKYADEGNSDISNILTVCTACHRHILWVQTYFGHYKKKA